MRILTNVFNLLCIIVNILTSNYNLYIMFMINITDIIYQYIFNHTILGKYVYILHMLNAICVLCVVIQFIIIIYKSYTSTIEIERREIIRRKLLERRETLIQRIREIDEIEEIEDHRLIHDQEQRQIEHIKQMEAQKEMKEKMIKELGETPDKGILKRCCICWEIPDVFIRLNCNHDWYCKSCSDQIKICAMCRVKIDSKLPVYI